MRHIIAVTLMLVTAAYPLIIYFGYGRLSSRTLALALSGLLVARALSLGIKTTQAKLMLGFSTIILIGSFASNTTRTLHWYPVMVNLGLLMLFSYSLRYPPSMIERFARLTEPNLPNSGVRYTRAVTQIWCVFFFLNACISAWTIYLANLKLWTLYNGLISYVLIGTLLGFERVFRFFYKKRHHVEDA